MELPRGVQLKPERMESFYEICRQLDRDFTGALRLKGLKGERAYNADLLIDTGSVIAASFQFKNSSEEMLRDTALAYIRKSLSGSSGKLNIFDFNSEEMRNSIESNAEALLEEDVKVNELCLKIKSSFVKKPGVGLFEKISGFVKKTPKAAEEAPGKSEADANQGARGSCGVEEQLVVSGDEKVRLGAEGAGGKPVKSTDSSEERKKRNIQSLKEKRLLKIRERISLERQEMQPTKKITEGMKVKTTIDRLYELIV
ncbi:MAG: DUF2226 domain-containing protein, partial [Candidatus Altiarchaeota archaeon]